MSEPVSGMTIRETWLILVALAIICSTILGSCWMMEVAPLRSNKCVATRTGDTGYVMVPCAEAK